MTEAHLKTGTTIVTEVIDSETGEILDTDIKTHKYLANSKEQFLLIYSCLLSAFINMTQSQIRVYGYLLRYASGIEFCITKSLRGSMSKEILVNERVIYTTIKELEEKKLLFKVNGNYRRNPRYAFQGSSLDRSGALKAIIELGCVDC